MSPLACHWNRQADVVSDSRPTHAHSAVVSGLSSEDSSRDSVSVHLCECSVDRSWLGRRGHCATRSAIRKDLKHILSPLPLTPKIQRVTGYTHRSQLELQLQSRPRRSERSTPTRRRAASAVASRARRSLRLSLRLTAVLRSTHNSASRRLAVARCTVAGPTRQEIPTRPCRLSPRPNRTPTRAHVGADPSPPAHAHTALAHKVVSAPRSILGYRHRRPQCQWPGCRTARHTKVKVLCRVRL